MSKKTLLGIPPIFQYEAAKDPWWMARLCGISVEWSVLTYFGHEHLDVNVMAEEGKAAGGYTEKGWSHDYLVGSFRSFGHPCERREKMDVKDLTPIRDALIEGNPVIVSAWWRPSLSNPVSHMIAIEGMVQDTNGEITGLYFMDPMRLHPKQFAETEAFVRDWRGMAIFPKLR